MSVNNGQRLAVTLPGFSGIAGYVERVDRDELSFEASLRSLRLRPGQQITVAENQRTVSSVAQSPFNRGFVVIELKK